MAKNSVKIETKFANKSLGAHTHAHPTETDFAISQFRFDHRDPAGETDSSGQNSPPLWKNGGPSPQKSPSHPLLGRHRHRHRMSSSPDSRTEAIARGQWEMMEMLKNMPESSYELSLKDLVESNQEIAKNGSAEEDREIDQQQRAVVKSNRSSPEGSRKISTGGRIGGFESRGLFLNMVSPLPVKDTKKKMAMVKNYGGGHLGSGKNSPRIEGSRVINGEADWWKKKRFTGSSDSDSSRASRGGSSTTTVSSGGESVNSGTGSHGGGRGGSRKRSGLQTGCWPFFCSRRGRSKSN